MKFSLLRSRFQLVLFPHLSMQRSRFISSISCSGRCRLLCEIENLENRLLWYDLEQSQKKRSNICIDIENEEETRAAKAKFINKMNKKIFQGHVNILITGLFCFDRPMVAESSQN
jgi:hypothetical protein